MRMKPAGTWLLLGALGGAIFGQACGRPTFVVAHYAGPAQPSETLGVVRVNGDESLELLAIDGDSANARVVEDARLHIEVLPGKHTVWVQDSNLRDVPGQRVSFMAEAGKVYRPVFVNAGAGPSARVFEVDRGSDAMLKDATLLEAPGAPPVPKAPDGAAAPTSASVPDPSVPPPSAPTPSAPTPSAPSPPAPSPSAPGLPAAPNPPSAGTSTPPSSTPTSSTPTPRPPSPPAPPPAPPAPPRAPPGPSSRPPSPPAPTSPAPTSRPPSPPAPTSPAPTPKAQPPAPPERRSQ